MQLILSRPGERHGGRSHRAYYRRYDIVSELDVLAGKIEGAKSVHAEFAPETAATKKCL